MPSRSAITRNSISPRQTAFSPTKLCFPLAEARVHRAGRITLSRRSAHETAHRCTLLLAITLVSLLGAQTKLRGTWSAELSGSEPWLQVSFQDAGGHHGSSFDLNRANIKLGDKQGPVQFAVTRDAGTFAFNGNVQGQLASGFVEFTANPQYVTEMAALGYPNLTEKQLFRMAMVDVSKKFVSDLNAAGYSKLGVDQLIRMSIHGADATFIREMAGAGYKNLAPEDLIRMRIHDVTPDFVKQMAANGYSNLSGESLVRMKIHDIDPEFAQAIRKAGFTSVDTEDLVRMKIHDVTPEFIAKIQQLGFKDITVEELVRMKIHDVSPEFIAKVKQLGYNDVSADEIVRLAIHDVSADYISQAKSGQPDISLDAIIRMKIQGGRRARL